MKKIIISLFISSIVLFSFTSCGRLSFFKDPAKAEKKDRLYTIGESVDSNYISYEEILIENDVPDPPLLFFTDETASFVREIITEDTKNTNFFGKQKDKKSKKDRKIVEKRTFGYDDDIVKDMEITFYLPADKYTAKDMQTYGKAYKNFSFAAVDYQEGDYTHVVTITFADLEYPKNITELTKNTDLVIAKNKHISMKETGKHLVEQRFSKKF